MRERVLHCDGGDLELSQRSLVIAIAGVTVLVLGSVGAYLWDASRGELVAGGIRVGGVEIGGLSAAQARAKLERELVGPLRRPVRIAFRGQRHTLTAARVGLHSDLDGMVDQALAASRAGGVLGRVWRALTGDELERDYPPRVTYSKRALGRFIDELAREIDRPPRDATVEPTAAGLNIVPPANGLELRRDRLRAEIVAELDSQAGDREVEAAARTVKPRVTLGELPGRYPYFITIDRGSFKLRFYRRLKLVKTYTIAVGRIGYETAAGLYHIQSRQVNPTWHVPKRPWAGKLAGRVIPPGPQNPLKARWMGFFDGAGIHGTDSIGSLGSAASHGCIRMSIPDVIELYDEVPAQTPLFIA